jgi:hypothetical protein
MKRRTSARLVRWAAVAALCAGVFEACSNSTDTVSTGITGPPVLGFATPPTDSTALGCDNTLVVHLTVNTPNWTFKPPDNCGTLPQCGSVRVSLLATADGSPLITQEAATADVQIDLTSLIDPKTPDGPSLSQVAFIKAELIGDTLLPYPPSAGAVTSVTTPISLTSLGCPSEAGAGGAAGAAGATSGSAGAAGATPAEGGGSAVGGSGGSGAGTGGSGGSANEAGADGIDTTAGGATP